jgi:predicted nucleotidyltransferase
VGISPPHDEFEFHGQESYHAEVGPRLGELICPSYNLPCSCIFLERMESLIIQELAEKGKIHPPKWLPANTQYLTIMGSQAYGTSQDNSDYDVYGFCIPRKEDVFPHLKGEIPGFGKQTQRFDQWIEHHITDEDSSREYDFTVFGIVKYFQLCMDNNPNALDSLFVPHHCLLHCTKIGTLMRDSRRKFLHKGVFHRMKGYAYSQLAKISSKTPVIGKRKELVDKFGWDTKFGSHAVRLLLEAEQIMAEGDLDLQRHNEQLKAIRRGEWTEDRLRKWASDKEAALEELYLKSDLPYGPDENFIKGLLLESLEIHYGNLKDCVVSEDKLAKAIRVIYDECVKVI